MALFLAMLFAGFAISYHCVSMCGMLVLSYAIKDDTEGPFWKRMLPHVAYQSARAFSYMAVGLALGAIGSAFNIQGIRPWIMVLAGAYMILMGLSMTGKFPILRYISPRPPKFMMQLLTKLRRRAKAEADAGESSLVTPIMFGAVTGLMPCGPLQSAQVAAIGAGSAFAGAFAMLGFWAGTMPLMLGFGAVSSMLSNKFKKYMMVAGSVAIMLVGAYTLNNGLRLAGSPVTFDTAKAYVLGSEVSTAGSQQYATGKDGVTEVKLTEDGGFNPSTVSIPADKPVRLIVSRPNDNPCSAQLAVPQLGILQNLTPNGTTVVNLPASKAGSYTLTCGMGMLSGRLEVGGGAAASGNRLPLLALLAAGAAAGAWVYRRRNAPAEEPEPAHGKSGKSGGRKVPAPAPTYFGFSPSEVLVVVTAVAVAVITGLYLGGMFS